MMHQYIFFPDRGKYILIASKLRYRLRFTVAVFLELIKALYLVYLHKEGEIEWSVYIIDLIFCYMHFCNYKIHEPLVDLLVNFQSYSFAPLALLDLLLYLFKKIFCFILIYGQVGISLNSESICAFYIVIKKQHIHISKDDLLKENNSVLTRITDW